MKGGYNRLLVEQLLPAVWDSEYAYGMRNPTAPDPTMPKGTVDKKAGSTLFAHLADIRTAWRLADIPHEERQALLMRFGLDLTIQEAGRVLDVRHQRISERADAGVGRLTCWLNAVAYVDSYDGDLDAEPAA